MREPRKDFWKSWLILFAAFICQIVSFGIVQNFGIYVTKIKETYGVPTSQTTLIGSIFYGSMCMSGPLTGFLFRRFGARPVVCSGGMIAALGAFLSGFTNRVWQLYFTYGLMTGVGFGFVYIGSLSVLPDYFDKYKFFATAFLTVGGSVGNLTFSHLLLPLIRVLGHWKYAMMSTSCLAALTALMSLILKNQTPPNPLLSPKSLLEVSLFKEAKFHVFCLGCVFWSGAVFIFFQLIHIDGISNSMTDQQVALLLTIQGSANLIGRVISAVVGQWTTVDRTILFFVATVSSTLGLTGIAFGHTFNHFIACVILVGLGYGGIIAQLAGCIISCFGVRRLPNALGYATFSMGVGGVSIPPLGGWLSKEWTFTSTFLLAGSCSCASAVFSAAIYLMQKRSAKKLSVSVETVTTVVSP